MTSAAAEARRAYKRTWAKNNPDKVKAQQERYWNKKAETMAATPGPVAQPRSDIASTSTISERE